MPAIGSIAKQIASNNRSHHFLPKWFLGIWPSRQVRFQFIYGHAFLRSNLLIYFLSHGHGIASRSEVKKKDGQDKMILKAYNGRCVQSWLTYVLLEALEVHSGNDHLVLVSSCMTLGLSKLGTTFDCGMEYESYLNCVCSKF